MKTLLLCVLICSRMAAGELKLLVQGNTIKVQGVGSSAVGLYASADMRNWQFEREFSRQTTVTNSTRFYKASLRPLHVSVNPSVEGTLAKVSGTANKVLSGLWLTNGSMISTGMLIRQSFGMSESGPSVAGCEWGFPVFNVGDVVIGLRFKDIEGLEYTTNVTLHGTAPQNQLRLDFPKNGVAVVGNYVQAIGSVDRLDSAVWIRVGTSNITVVVRNDGTFVSPKIAVGETNNWRIYCRSVHGETVEEVGFSKSSITITYQINNTTFIYGERGIVITGTISDAGSDLMIGTNLVVTTNGTWRARIPFPDGGLLPFTIIPKNYGVNATQSTKAFDPVTWKGILEFDFGPYFYAYAFLNSTTYKEKWMTNIALIQYSGFNKQNRVSARKIEAGNDCMITYSGIGEYLMWESEVGRCSGSTFRTILPETHVSEYADEDSGSSLHSIQSSGCRVNTGGHPDDPRLYEITIDLALYEVEFRDRDEVYFYEIPTSSRGWRIGGQECPYRFNSYCAREVDATPTMPADCTGWYWYQVLIRKELKNP